MFIVVLYRRVINGKLVANSRALRLKGQQSGNISIHCFGGVKSRLIGEPMHLQADASTSRPRSLEVSTEL